MCSRVLEEGGWHTAAAAGAVLLVICGLVSSGCSGGQALPAIGAGPPRLVVPEEALDLGQGAPGEELKGLVLLNNAGGASLHIDKVDPGCDCAGYQLSRPDIPPGEQAELRLAARIRAEGQRLSLSVHIYSNDPAAPISVCLVKAQASPPVIRTDPASLDFGEVALGTCPARRLRCLRPDGSPWPAGEAVLVESTRGHVRVVPAQEQPEDAPAALVVEVWPDADLLSGPFSDTLTLHPTEGRRTAEVAVRGTVVPPLIVSPMTLYFGDVKAQGEPLKRNLLLRRADGKPLRPLLKSTAPPGVRVEELDAAGTPAAGAPRRLLVTLDPAALTQDVRDGKVLLWLQDEPEPVVVGLLIVLSREPAQAKP